MNIPFVDLKPQYQAIKKEIDEAIQSVVDSDLLVGGAAVEKFEKEFASYLGVEHCVGVANGSDALEIAMKALGVGTGDEVIVPSLTWISTAGAVNNVGAEPVFVDVLEHERTLDPSLIEEKITSKTKAIIPVHLYGLPARMGEIMSIAQKHSLKVIEDCAQAHGASIKGKKVGAFGDVGTFSFYPTKNLGAYGDGGVIVTKDVKLSERVRLYANHGQLTKHDHSIIGRNSRLDSIQAAILSVKLKYLDEWNAERNQLAREYQKGLGRVEKPAVPSGFDHVFHLYVIQSKSRDLLKKKLEEEGIGSSIHYPKPVPFLKAYGYKKHRSGEFPIAEKLCNEILSLPMYVGLSSESIRKIASLVL